MDYNTAFIFVSIQFVLISNLNFSFRIVGENLTAIQPIHRKSLNVQLIGTNRSILIINVYYTLSKGAFITI